MTRGFLYLNFMYHAAACLCYVGSVITAWPGTNAKVTNFATSKGPNQAVGLLRNGGGFMDFRLTRYFMSIFFRVYDKIKKELFGGSKWITPIA